MAFSWGPAYPVQASEGAILGIMVPVSLVVEWVGCRICDQQVASSSPIRGLPG